MYLSAGRLLCHILLCLPLCWFLLPSAACGQFTAIINLPPNPDIGNNQSIGSNTQLNLFDSGSIGWNFDAGASDGSSTNIEVNIHGGLVGEGLRAFNGSEVNIFGGSIESGFSAFNGSTLNVSGGEVGYDLNAYDGSIINIAGGSIDDDFKAFSGSVVRVSGGLIGKGFAASGNSQVMISGGEIGSEFQASSGSSVNISGGTVGDFFQASTGSEVNLFGGSVGDGFDVWDGSSLNIFGGEYRLDGVPINGLESLGSTLPLNLPDGSVLSGTIKQHYFCKKFSARTFSRSRC